MLKFEFFILNNLGTSLKLSKERKKERKKSFCRDRKRTPAIAILSAREIRTFFSNKEKFES